MAIWAVIAPATAINVKRSRKPSRAVKLLNGRAEGNIFTACLIWKIDMSECNRTVNVGAFSVALDGKFRLTF